MPARARSLRALNAQIVRCEACPRLLEHRRSVATVKRRAYASERYWGRPVPGFGDPRARLLIVGLAPGAHGANRTGRVFTGDRSGDFLYAALHRAGLASSAVSERRDDGLTLRTTYITLPVRCVPPDNSPSREEIARCAPWLQEELQLLSDVRAVLALGAIAYHAMLAVGGERPQGRADGLRTSTAVAQQRQHKIPGPRPTPPFLHGQRVLLDWPFSPREVELFASYHVSQQNTQTGRLTPAMFDQVLGQCLRAAGVPEPRRDAASSP